MGAKRQKRQEDKRASKNGLDPVTGQAMSKKDKKKLNRYGINEDGTGINSKKQNKQGRKMANKDKQLLKVEGKNEAKSNRTLGRRAKKEGKGAKKASEGLATEILAEQGIDSQANQKEAIGNAFSDSIGSIASAFGGGGSDDEFDDFDDDFEGNTKRADVNEAPSKLPFIIGGLVVGFVLLKMFKIIK
jgi:hypothetical protein